MKYLKQILFFLGIALFNEASASKQGDDAPEGWKPPLKQVFSITPSQSSQRSSIDGMSRLAIYYMERSLENINEDPVDDTNMSLGSATLNALQAAAFMSGGAHSVWPFSGSPPVLCKTCESRAECFSVRVERALKMQESNRTISVLLSEKPIMGQKICAIKLSGWIFPERMTDRRARMIMLGLQDHQVAMAYHILKLTQKPTYIPLPKNVLQKILIRAYVQDLNNLRRVCKSWKEAADDLIEQHFAALAGRYARVNKMIVSPNTLSIWQTAALWSRLYVLDGSALANTFLETFKPKKIGLGDRNKMVGQAENDRNVEVIVGVHAYTEESPAILAGFSKDLMKLIFCRLPSKSLAVVAFVNRQFAAAAGELLIIRLSPIRDRILLEFHNTQSKQAGTRPKDNLIAAWIYDANRPG